MQERKSRLLALTIMLSLTVYAVQCMTTIKAEQHTPSLKC